MARPAKSKSSARINTYLKAAKEDDKLTLEDLHARLSHISVTAIHEMISKGMVAGIKLHPGSMMEQCASCEYGKATRKPIGNACEPARLAKLSDEVHTNVWGPSPVLTPGKWAYYSSFTDDHTHYMHVNLMFTKSDTFSAYSTSGGAFSLSGPRMRLHRLIPLGSGESTRLTGPSRVALELDAIA